MDVGPLNPIQPPVQKPQEGKPERTGEVKSDVNRLTAKPPDSKRVSGDRADISNKDTSLKDMQAKVAIGNTASRAVLTLIKGIKDAGKGLNSEKARDDIDKALNAKFDGKPVFNGKQLTHRTSNGKTVSVTVPDRKKATQLIQQAADDIAKGKKPESRAFRELNKLHEKTVDFTKAVKDDVKNMVDISNKTASHTKSADVRAMRESLRQVSNRLDKTAPQDVTRQMAHKTVKLLK